MKKRFEELQRIANTTPFDQNAYDAAFAATEEAALENEATLTQAENETKSRIEKIITANKVSLDTKDAEIAELKTKLSTSEQARDHNATQAASARQELADVVKTKDAELATANAATATEKAAKEAAEQGREAETARANGLHTQLNDANTAHAAQISALNTDLTNARQAATNAANSRDALCADLDTWNKEVNPDATDINKNTNNPVALVKGNVAAKAIADAKAKAPEAPKPDNAPQAPNASWSKGRLFALVGAGVLAGCVIGAIAYNNSSTLQSCYKFCADSKVGCKLADFANFICKFFTRSSSAEISR